MTRLRNAALPCLTALLLAAPAEAVESVPPLRIETLLRCGDLLAARELEFCLRVAGLADAPLEARLGDRPVPVTRGGEGELRLRITAQGARSGPLHVAQAGRTSNAVWLSLQPSAVVAAGPGGVAPNDDGIPSYVDLVSVIVEEEYDALAEARRVAGKYGAQLVGQIPALSLFQLRLPARNLLERDALVLRIGSEERIDAVVIEESPAEEADAAPVPPAPGAPPAAPGAELAANRYADAVDFYRRRIPGPSGARIEPAPVRIGVVERSVDFDAPGFAEAAPGGPHDLRLYARDARSPAGHGSTLVGLLAARPHGDRPAGFLRALDGHAGGFDLIVDRGSDAGMTANVASSVNLVLDGASVLNWSFGVHRVGARRADGSDLDGDTLVRSGIAVAGYEELLESFFTWLRLRHPDVLVVNSAGNGAADSSEDDYRLPSSFVTDQLLVVGAHERSEADVPVEDPRFARRRPSSNLGQRVDVTAAGCVRGAAAPGGELHCGTSYATALVTALVAAMRSIDPALTPEELRTLLRRSSLPIGEEFDFEPVDAEDLTAPIVPSERGFALDHPDVGRAARIDMRKALELAVDSRLRRPVRP